MEIKMKKAISLFLMILCFTAAFSSFGTDLDENAIAQLDEIDSSYQVAHTANTGTVAEAGVGASIQHAMIIRAHSAHPFSYLIFLNTVLFCILMLVIAAKQAKWF
ncbi:MAG: hypothetical protein HFE78_05290 [Clostridiales bacterium]|nr:hypothetical protein [Clostridiales bacterium]